MNSPVSPPFDSQHKKPPALYTQQLQPTDFYIISTLLVQRSEVCFSTHPGVCRVPLLHHPHPSVSCWIIHGLFASACVQVDEPWLVNCTCMHLHGRNAVCAYACTGCLHKRCLRTHTVNVHFAAAPQHYTQVAVGTADRSRTVHVSKVLHVKHLLELLTQSL